MLLSTKNKANKARTERVFGIAIIDIYMIIVHERKPGITKRAEKEESFFFFAMNNIERAKNESLRAWRVDIYRGFLGSY